MFRPAPLGRERGIERQEQERAQIVSAALGRESSIGFDAAAAVAPEAPKKKMWVHATSGALMEQP